MRRNGQHSADLIGCSFLVVVIVAVVVVVVYVVTISESEFEDCKK